MLGGKSATAFSMRSAAAKLDSRSESSRPALSGRFLQIAVLGVGEAGGHAVGDARRILRVQP